jgi:hypothetical protein
MVGVSQRTNRALRDVVAEIADTLQGNLDTGPAYRVA